MPKGVELPQFAWIAAGYRYIESFDIRPDDVHYSVLALFHNGGLMIGCIGPLAAGIPTHIDRWFSLSRFRTRVRETGATVIDPIGRSQEHRVGKEGDRTGEPSWTPYP